MKKLFICLSLIAFCLFIFSCSKENKQTGTVPVIPMKDLMKVSDKVDSIRLDNYSGIKNHDLIVMKYKQDSGGNMYHIVYFHNNTGKMRHYRASFIDSADFSRVAYTWINDTMVEMKFNDSLSGKKINFRLFGNYNGSGMNRENK